LQGCDNMWRGIIAKSNNPPGLFGKFGLSLEGTTIEDAWRAIELEDKTSFRAQGCFFFDNYIGIYTTPVVGAKTTIHAELYNNLFEDLDDMKASYSGQPQWSSRFFAGIVINGCQRFTIGNDEFT